jgi:predicted MPP superfamily phosphohydrolase
LFFFLKRKTIQIPLAAQKTIWLIPLILSIISLLPLNLKPKLVSTTFSHPQIPSAFNNLKIGIVSDLHLGPIIRQNTVEHIAKAFQREKPDLIVFLGDLFETKSTVLQDWCQQLFSYKPHLGSYFVWGNHEYINRDIQGFQKVIQDHGVIILTDQEKIIEYQNHSLVLGGINDPASHRFDFPAASFDQIGHLKGDFKIFLSHRPETWKTACDRGYHLQLSGHTHGGQFYPFRFLVKLHYGSQSENWSHQEDCGLYVTQGTGYYGVPMRLGTQSEITFISLEAKNQSSLFSEEKI